MNSGIAIFQIALAPDVLGAWGIWPALIAAIGVIIGAFISKPLRRTKSRRRPRSRTRPARLLTLHPQSEIRNRISIENSAVTIVTENPAIPHQAKTPILSHTKGTVRARCMEQRKTIPTSATDRAQLEFTLT